MASGSYVGFDAFFCSAALWSFEVSSRGVDCRKAEMEDGNSCFRLHLPTLLWLLDSVGLSQWWLLWAGNLPGFQWVQLILAFRFNISYCSVWQRPSAQWWCSDLLTQTYKPPPRGWWWASFKSGKEIDYSGFSCKNSGDCWSCWRTCDGSCLGPICWKCYERGGRFASGEQPLVDRHRLESLWRHLYPRFLETWVSWCQTSSTYCSLF